MIRGWFKEFGIGVLGLLIGVIPITIRAVNSYADFRATQVIILRDVDTLKSGQKEILSHLEKLRMERKK